MVETLEFKGRDRVADVSDTWHTYSPLCDVRSGLNSNDEVDTTVLPEVVELTCPLSTTPLGSSHVMSGVTDRDTCFITAQDIV